jgi:ubiquinone/menaquinone biosynthesis C-methylase UbiE/uncharacterized protein YbaR (Trm112 family)
MDKWLRANLVCPRDKRELKDAGNNLVCSENHIYPVVEDVPIMLLEEEEHIHGYITETLESVAKIDSSGTVENQTEPSSSDKNEVDPYVQAEIPYTCGNLYMPLLHKLKRYPIPELRLPTGNGERLLDVGCNWGRWTVAAAQNGYQPVGIDPSLKAVLAARRISKQLGVTTNFVVGDARYLPFATSCFDVGFSYSVLQHFSKPNAKISLDEIGRTVKKGEKVFVQMPNKYGLRSFYQNARRGFTEGEGFDVRYWSPSELLETFKKKFGETKMSVDCYFGLNIQKNDVDMLPTKFKMVVHSSEFLRRMSRKISWLVNVADSVYLESVNQNKI